MSFADEFNLDDDPPSAEEMALVRQAGMDTRKRLDEALLRSASYSWRKMARLVADAMTEMKSDLPEVSDSYYSYRLRELVASGRLEARGRLSIMRFCELRLLGPGNER